MADECFQSLDLADVQPQYVPVADRLILVHWWTEFNLSKSALANWRDAVDLSLGDAGAALYTTPLIGLAASDFFKASALDFSIGIFEAESITGLAVDTGPSHSVLKSRSAVSLAVRNIQLRQQRDSL
jgi:hypothetical protein